MPIELIPIPARLNVSDHPMHLQVWETPELKNADTMRMPGRLRRGRGYARSSEVSGSSETIIAAKTFRRRDCRKLLVDASAGGTWRASMSDAGNLIGRPCVGPGPDYMDAGDADNQRVTTVPATAEGTTVIWADAQKGRKYRVWAMGRWRQDPDVVYEVGPQGNFGFVDIPGGNTFAGMRFGAFAVKEPGGNWVYAGKYKIVTASADGDLLGSFADADGAWGDNHGFLTVIVTEEENA